MTEYEAELNLPDFSQPYMCHSPNPGLSLTLRDGNYDEFIKNMGYEMRLTGKTFNAIFNIKCEGQCPKGCQKKFHIKNLKSISKKTFDKLHKHGKKYPYHCFILKFDADIKVEDM